MKATTSADAKLVSLLLHTRGQRDRLLSANRHQSEDIFALTAALRETYGILKARGGGRTDAQRIETACKHLSNVIRRFGPLLIPSRKAPNVLVDPDTTAERRAKSEV